MANLYTVTFNQGCKGGHVVFVAFDRATADAFAKDENDEVQCEILEVDALPLVDNYGYPCQRKDAGFLFPWLAKFERELFKIYAPEFYARKEAEYIRQMSQGG